MKFGLFHELATPRPFTAESESLVVHNALEQVRDVARSGLENSRRQKEACEKEIARLTTAGAEAHSQAEIAHTSLGASMAQSSGV